MQRNFSLSALSPVLSILMVALAPCACSSDPEGSGLGTPASSGGTSPIAGASTNHGGSTSAQGGSFTSVAGSAATTGGGGAGTTGGSSATGGSLGNGGAGGTAAGGGSEAGGSGGSGPGAGMSLGQFVMTWYSFQDNTPVNSAQSSSGRELHAYVSVAVPFRFLKEFGGDLDYGQNLYLSYLAGKPMPNGKMHSGWVQIDDYCGDDMDDSYCYQELDGKSYPNTDLFIGDFPKSGMAPKDGDCSGPAGSGQELTEVTLGEPGSKFVSDYGVPTLGAGKCGDYAKAEADQGGVNGDCWHYTPPMDTVMYCTDCNIGKDCTSK